MKITFPYWGNYTIVFQRLLEKCGIVCVPPEETNEATIRNGAKLSPELFCFPLKVNIGNYISAIEKGADTILMWENVGGSCRLRYYWVIQEKILKEAGYDVKVLNLNTKNFLFRLKELSKSKISLFQFLKIFYSTFKELRFVEKLEEKLNYFRPREKERGRTERIFNTALEKFKKVKNNKDLNRLQKEIWQEFSQIKIDKNREVLKLGLVGEIYTVSDGKTNFELEKKLGEMQIEVHRKLNLSQFLIGSLPWQERMLQKAVNPYLKTTVGGHGRQAICEMLDYKKEGFDGVIQLLPFGCMPEVTIRPILQQISQEKRMPFPSVSLDEQTAEVGLQTRLEAFVDLMKSRKKQLTNININSQIS